MAAETVLIDERTPFDSAQGRSAHGRRRTSGWRGRRLRPDGRRRRSRGLSLPLRDTIVGHHDVEQDGRRTDSGSQASRHMCSDEV